MLTNHKPVINGTDEGVWRRVRLVPWDVVIPAAERDELLGDRLKLELGAVLAYLVDGYRQWKERGLADPEKVTRATEAYRAESDALKRFIADQCLTGPHFTVGSSDLFAAWGKWCAAEGEDQGTATAFATMLQNKGFDNYTSAGRRRWRGLGLQGEDPR
jgi:putative DNA primase/helicase